MQAEHADAPATSRSARAVSSRSRRDGHDGARRGRHAADAACETIGGTIPLTGTAGNEATDDATVTIKIYGDPSQAPVRTVTTTRTGTAWSTSTAALPTGTYTVKAEQSDAAGNTGVSAGVVFKAGNTYQQEILADNPRGFWRLGEACGTTAADLGSGNNPAPTPAVCCSAARARFRATRTRPRSSTASTTT